MVYIFRRVGGVKSRSEGEESWQPVFLAKRCPRAHEYCVYSWWRTGWMVEHWRDFFIFLWKSFVPKINHHVGVMATGNIGIPGVLFNLTLRAWEPVDFSNRHPRAGKEQATRDGAVLQELIMNKSSELVRLSLFGYLELRPRDGSGSLVLAPGCGPSREGHGGHDSSNAVHSWIKRIMNKRLGETDV